MDEAIGAIFTNVRAKQGMIGLMNNFDQLKEKMETIKNATGTVQEKWSIATDTMAFEMERMNQRHESSLRKTGEAWKWTYMSAQQFITDIKIAWNGFVGWFS